MNNLTLVIPAKNEKDSLPYVLEELSNNNTRRLKRKHKNQSMKKIYQDFIYKMLGSPPLQK